MRRAAIAWTRSLSALAVLALVVGACAEATPGNQVPNFFPAPAITDQGQASESLYAFIFWIAVAIFVLVEGLIIFAVLRYRRRKGDDELPVQTHGSMPFELAWTIVPFIIVVALFILSENTQQKVDASTPNPPLTVDVTGFQWQWTFDYQAQGLSFTGQGTDGPTMVLPVGEDVHFRLHSNDVIHSFYLPALLLQEGRRARAHQRVRPHPGRRRAPTPASAPSSAAWAMPTCASPCRPSRRPTSPPGWPRSRRRPRRRPRRCPRGAQSLTLSASNTTAFDESTLTATAGQPFAVVFTNNGPAGGPPHDFAIKDPAGGSTMLFTGQPLAQAGQTVTYNVPALAAGTYTFICIVHPNMTGTLTVK